MGFSSFIVLLFLSIVIVLILITKFSFSIDCSTFLVVLYNLSVMGILVVFLSKFTIVGDEDIPALVYDYEARPVVSHDEGSRDNVGERRNSGNGLDDNITTDGDVSNSPNGISYERQSSSDSSLIITKDERALTAHLIDS
ncbi:Presenilin-like protein At2g29900 [Linum perenne]